MTSIARDYAQALIADINEWGHFNDEAANTSPDKAPGAERGPVCVVANHVGSRPYEFRVALSEKMMEQGWTPLDEGFYSRMGFLSTTDQYKWNDTTPTQKVLDTLASIA